MKPLPVILILIIMVSVLTLLNLQYSADTGAIISEMGQVRLDRLNLIQKGLPFDKEESCRQQATAAENLLRLNTQRAYYSPNGLQGTELYFMQEKELFKALSELSGNLNCQFNVRQRAFELLSNLTDIDSRFVSYSVTNSNCFSVGNAKTELVYASESNTSFDALIHLERAAVFAQC